MVTSGAQQDLAEYQSAVETLRVTRAGTSLHTKAQSIVDTLGPSQWDVPVPCILCGNTDGRHTVTIAEMATWVNRPRGICTSCDNKVTEEVRRG